MKYQTGQTYKNIDGCFALVLNEVDGILLTSESCIIYFLETIFDGDTFAPCSADEFQLAYNELNGRIQAALSSVKAEMIS